MGGVEVVQGQGRVGWGRCRARVGWGGTGWGRVG